jgi:Zn-dependent M28 family amino/carboxypeptidase
MRYVGANDSGSSSALLLQLAAFFQKGRKGLLCDILFVWFDGEESTLDDWNRAEREPYGQQDNTYGSRYFVSQLKVCGKDEKGKEQLCWREQLDKPIRELILLDMVGSPDLKISLDRLSSSNLIERLQSVVKNLGYEKHLDTNFTFVEDDHVPFRKAGISALDIIDFNNLDYWHKPGDEIKNLSFSSIEIAGQIAAKMVLKSD